jgi:hypothetical protein
MWFGNYGYDMNVRLRFYFVIFSVSFNSCLCAPPVPKGVTLRLKNTSQDTLYVDTTDGRLGMQVQRSVASGYVSFDETPRCACLGCDKGCGTCDCPEAKKPLIQRVPPDSSFDRNWAGVVQIQSPTVCGSANRTCLTPENAPYNETFNLRLCYALIATLDGTSTDGGAVEGVLSTDVSCVDKTFKIEDGVAEIGPQRGATCVTKADCKDSKELCLDGQCTASCPANTFPSEAHASIGVGIDDQGFFTVVRDAGVITYTGTGVVSSVNYNASSMKMVLSRTGTSNETLTGTIYLDVPRVSDLGPLDVAQKVSIKLVDRSPTKQPTSNVGFVLRDGNGKLIVAIDAALTTPNLVAADLAPFTVAFDTPPMGCRVTGCGRELFSKTRFSDGIKSVELQPGGAGNLVSINGTYRALNIFSAEYDASSSCDIKVIRPYLIWRDKPPTG